MARLIYSATTSLDGYINDAHGDFDFTAPDAEVHAFVNDRERDVGTYLLGRRMYDVMRFWDTAPVAELSAVEADYAGIWSRIDKVVYSRTPAAGPAARTRFETRFEPAAVRALKAQSSSDLSIGGADVGGQALAAGLVDVLRVYIVPEVVGAGTRLLPDGLRLGLELVDETRFANGTVHLQYAVTN